MLDLMNYHSIHYLGLIVCPPVSQSARNAVGGNVIFNLHSSYKLDHIGPVVFLQRRQFIEKQNF